MSLLINLDIMKMVATGDCRALAALAFDDFPEAAILIGPEDLKSTFRDFTESELKLLFRNTAGVDPVGMNRWNALDLIMPLVEKVPICSKQIPLDSLAKPPEQQEPASVPISARPKQGTATGRVWEIADKLIEAELVLKSAVTGAYEKSLKAEVVAKASAEGINGSTAAVQFGKWKKHQESL